MKYKNGKKCAEELEKRTIDKIIIKCKDAPDVHVNHRTEQFDFVTKTLINVLKLVKNVNEIDDGRKWKLTKP